MRIRVGDLAPQVHLLDMHDVQVSLAELYQPHGLVISFLRHFG